MSRVASVGMYIASYIAIVIFVILVYSRYIAIRSIIYINCMHVDQ